jgi:glutaredoxin
MMADRLRCETHGLVLTATGACLRCERRAPAVPVAEPSHAMTWLVAGVVGALLATAVGVRFYSALSDRRAAESGVRAEPNVAAPGATLAVVPASAPTIPTEVRHADPAGAQREHARRVTEAARSVQINFYGAGWCPTCRVARTWLDTEKIGYTYLDVDDTVNNHTMRSLNPKSTIPTIDIEGQVIVGFDERAMRDSIRRAAEARVAKTER